MVQSTRDKDMMNPDKEGLADQIIGQLLTVQEK